MCTIKWNTVAGFMCGLCLLCGFMVSDSSAQEKIPFSVNVYAFYMPLSDVKDYLKDGLTGKEFSEMQVEHFKKGAILPEAKPIKLSDGDNVITIPEAQRAQLFNDIKNKSVVFIFEVIKQKDIADEILNITRNSYAVSVDANGEEKLIRPKKGEWRVPARTLRYRFLDFRHVVTFQNNKFVYEFDVGEGETPIQYKLIVNTTG